MKQLRRCDIMAKRYKTKQLLNPRDGSNEKVVVYSHPKVDDGSVMEWQLILAKDGL
jgi:hypothetical protein